MKHKRTQKSLSNKTAFCWPMQQIHVTNLKMRKLLITWIPIWITVFCQQKKLSSNSKWDLKTFLLFRLPWCYPNITLSHLQIGFAYSSWLLQKTVSMNISWSNPICIFLFIYTHWVTACQVPTAHFNKSSKYVWFYCLLLPQHQLWSMWCGLPAIEPQLFEAAFPSLSTENKCYWHFLSMSMQFGSGIRHTVSVVSLLTFAVSTRLLISFIRKGLKVPTIHL